MRVCLARQALSVVSGAASKEASLRRALAGMQAEWQGLAFRLVPYKASSPAATTKRYCPLLVSLYA
jgi:hypothetical protein